MCELFGGQQRYFQSRQAPTASAESDRHTPVWAEANRYGFPKLLDFCQVKIGTMRKNVHYQ